MKPNIEWHIANTFIVNAVYSKKIEWHKEHKKQCGCKLSSLEIMGAVWKKQLKEKVIRENDFLLFNH